MVESAGAKGRKLWRMSLENTKVRCYWQGFYRWFLDIVNPYITLRGLSDLFSLPITCLIDTKMAG